MQNSRQYACICGLSLHKRRSLPLCSCLLVALRIRKMCCLFHLVAGIATTVVALIRHTHKRCTPWARSCRHGHHILSVIKHVAHANMLDALQRTRCWCAMHAISSKKYNMYMALLRCRRQIARHFAMRSLLLLSMTILFAQQAPSTRACLYVCQLGKVCVWPLNSILALCACSAHAILHRLSMLIALLVVLALFLLRIGGYDGKVFDTLHGQAHSIMEAQCVAYASSIIRAFIPCNSLNVLYKHANSNLHLMDAHNALSHTPTGMESALLTLAT